MKCRYSAPKKTRADERIYATLYSDAIKYVLCTKFGWGKTDDKYRRWKIAKLDRLCRAKMDYYDTVFDEDRDAVLEVIKEHCLGYGVDIVGSDEMSRKAEIATFVAYIIVEVLCESFGFRHRRVKRLLTELHLYVCDNNRRYVELGNGAFTNSNKILASDLSSIGLQGMTTEFRLRNGRVY